MPKKIVKIPIKQFKKEHEKLIPILAKGSKNVRVNEAKDQLKEVSKTAGKAEAKKISKKMKV